MTDTRKKTFANYIPNPGWEERAMEGAYEGVGKKTAAKTNKQFQSDCAEVGVEPTGRQYANWAKGHGRWAK